MKFSIITPSFNQAQFLPYNLASVRSQLDVDVEHIIVDPGSTDGSTEIARQADNVLLIAEPDRGQSDGINKGFSRASGDILAWLNSDDCYPSTSTLSKVAKVFARHPEADIVYGEVDFVDESGEFLRKGYVNKNERGLGDSFAYQVGIVQPGVFWRREVFETLGGPSEEFEYCMDYELWVRMATHGLRWKHTPKTLAHHRWWGGMKTSSRRDLSLVEHFKVCHRYFGYIHWKWLDRYAEYIATDADGVVHHAEKVDPHIKEKALQHCVQKFVTQEMLRSLERSEDVQKIETYEFIKSRLDASSRIYFDASELEIISETTSDPDAMERIAWHTFAATDSLNNTYAAYHVPSNFNRYYNADWHSRQLLRSEEAILRMRSERSSDVCVIVGNGPSLANSDLSLLQNVDTIVANFASLSPQLREHANYLCIVNDLVAEQGAVEFNATNLVKFVPFWLANNINPTGSTYYVNATVEPEFSTDFVRNASWRSTVSFFNMQLAYALGYTKVLLIGFDHSYVQPKGVSEGSVIRQTEDDTNHFDPRYFKGRDWQAADTDNMEKMYQLAKVAYEGDGREIVNCTVGGKLEVFRRAVLADELGTDTATASDYPKLLILDPIPTGQPVATGQLKKAFLGRWAPERFMQIWQSPGTDRPYHVLKGSEGANEVKPRRLNLDKALKACRDFNPDVIYFRPADSEPIFTVFEELKRESNIPSIIHIMDDWPERMRHNDPSRFAAIQPRLKNAIDRCCTHLTISQPMADEYTERYGRCWQPLANGADLSISEARIQTNDIEDRPFTVRYMGALADDMTLQSVTEVAEVIGKLSQKIAIRFEIYTMKWFQNAARQRMGHIPMVTISDLVPDEFYEESLREADALVLAYNFDSSSQRYTRLSLANKLPECLASGTPLLAYGPSDHATMALLEKANCALTVTRQDTAELQANLEKLATNSNLAQEIGARGKAYASDYLRLDQVQDRFLDYMTNAANRIRFIHGPFLREQQAHYDETNCIARLFEQQKTDGGTMIDVGAHQGGALSPFLDEGWKVFAFEPDAGNRRKLQRKLEEHRLKSNVSLDDRCVSNKSEQDLAFFTSDQSTGISGLSAFHSSHKVSQRVDTVSLTDFFSDQPMPEIKFLKIDTEGHDLFVLQGYPWERGLPEVIECEFEDSKTIPRGYTFDVLAQFLCEKGYVVYVSEWHPIIRYGMKHDWRGLKAYPCDLATPDAWGNILAFRTDPGEKAIKQAILDTLSIAPPKVTQNPSNKPSPANRGTTNSGSTTVPFYFKLGQWLRRKSLTLFRVFQLAHWVVQVFTRRPIESLLALTALGILLLLPVLQPSLRPWASILWGFGGLTLAAALGLTAVSFVHKRLISFAENTKKEQRLFFNEIKTEMSLLRSQVEDIGSSGKDASSRLEQLATEATVLAEKVSALAELQSSVSTSLTRLTDEQQATSNASREQLRDLQEQLNQQDEKLTSSQTVRHRARRTLTDEQLHVLTYEWTQRLNVDYSMPMISYLAERIQLTESKCRGRIATPVDNMLLRILAAASIPKRELNILEVGTLFGIGLAAIYDCVRPNFDQLHLTAIDPLAGYYDEGPRDILTGEPVNQETFTFNMNASGIPDNEYTLIPKLSTDPDLGLEDTLFDIVILDGDHSYEGVKWDFERFRDSTAPDGLILFDDYGSEEWPDVKAYVDEVVHKDPGLKFVGASFRTAVFRKSS